METEYYARSIMFKIKHLVCLYIWIKTVFNFFHSFKVIYYFNQNDIRTEYEKREKCIVKTNSLFFNDIKWIVWYEEIVKIFIFFI